MATQNLISPSIEYALMPALFKGKLSEIQSFIKNNPEILQLPDALGGALKESSQNGYLPIVQYLVEQGADVHFKDDFPLRLAATNGHLHVVQYLVEQGANIHADQDGAFSLSVANGHFDVMQYLAEQGADIQSDNNAALRWASSDGRLDMVRYLIERGANISDNNNYTLYITTTKGHLPVVQYLLENGGDAAFVLDVAQKNQNIDIIHWVEGYYTAKQEQKQFLQATIDMPTPSKNRL